MPCSPCVLLRSTRNAISAGKLLVCSQERRWPAARESDLHRLRAESGKLAVWSVLAPALQGFRSPGPMAYYWRTGATDTSRQLERMASAAKLYNQTESCIVLLIIFGIVSVVGVLLVLLVR